MPPSSSSRELLALGGHLARARVRALRPDVGEGLPHAGERDPVLRPLGPGDARHHAREVQLDHLAEDRDLGVVGSEHPLFLCIALDQVDVPRIPPRTAEILERSHVDGKQRRGGAELGRHVGERCAVGHRHRAQAAAAELHELVDDAVLAEQLGQRQHEVGSGRPRGQRVVEAHPDHDRGEQEQRLAEHAGLSLDAADAPAEHADAIDHRRVRIGADERVRQCRAHAVDLAHLDHLRQVLEVDLVHDSHPRRHHPEPLKRLLGPAQQ